MTIAEDFYLGKYEVTQAQWTIIMGDYPSYFSRTGGGRERVKDASNEDLKRFPVENVSYEMIQDFLKKKNDRKKTRNSGWKYRLPLAAEWEYASRGGRLFSHQGRNTGATAGARSGVTGRRT